MTRMLVASGLTLLALAIAPANARGPIDLDLPGNLEAIQRTNPEHYAKIERILAEVPRRPPNEVTRWMRTEFQARDVQYADLVMTSLPPKKRLQFSLDNESYAKVVTLSGWTAKPMPAKKLLPEQEPATDPPVR